MPGLHAVSITEAGLYIHRELTRAREVHLPHLHMANPAKCVCACVWLGDICSRVLMQTNNCLLHFLLLPTMSVTA